LSVSLPCSASLCFPPSHHLLRGIGSVSTTAKGFQEKEIREKLQAFPGGSIDLVKQESGIAVLTVNNPARMNAFSGSMMVELEERVSQLEEWTEGKGLIIQGAAGTFCSGSVNSFYSVTLYWGTPTSIQSDFLNHVSNSFHGGPTACGVFHPPLYLIN
uniref:Ethylmalonyl-CoA decarboxylase 1 n=1 Tax=Salmo trutta TaxID=8032 RepID=A0A674AT83_SALTR